MPSLPDELFSLVERKVLEARSAAEEAAQAAINALAVNRAEPFRTLSPEQRRLRNALRARARQLGDGSQHRGLPLLVEEIAYQQWHRMLFARFLAENGLLMHPTGIPVTLQDCAELAPEEGEPDAWSLAAQYASTMLPGIFRQDDPVVQVRFAPEGRLTLEGILDELPSLVFTADDSLGWMYQFWQSQKKEEVNRSERKIGGADIAPVTEFFTEDYMVRFLLENTLGAWWAARHPDSPLVKTFTYLRFREDGTPAAGTFPGWPDRAAEITIMDPCCGSGHFLVVAFEMLRHMRVEEEGLDEAAAADAVLHDNIFGLELDPRCTQIAAFALAMAAWKTGGYRELPVPNVACSGVAVEGQLTTWLNLAGDDLYLQTTLQKLHHLFKNAPALGSLINPRQISVGGNSFSLEYSRFRPLLEKALVKERSRDDPVSEAFGVAAQGVLRAAQFLTNRYTLVATNVPYLIRGKQEEGLKSFCEDNYPDSKLDLANVFIERCLAFARQGGSCAIVTPQNWLFLGSYANLRQKLLNAQSWNVVARLGPGAFRTISGEVVNVILIGLTNTRPSREHTFTGIDASKASTPLEKAKLLRNGALVELHQSEQLRNPDYRVVFSELGKEKALSHFATVYEGMHSGDYVRFGRRFWELDRVRDGWFLQQAGPDQTTEYAGREHVLFWEDGSGTLVQYVQERLGTKSISMWIKGENAWGKRGVAVSVMSKLKATLYTGEIFTHGVVAIIPKKEEYLSAFWEYAKSEEFRENVRKLDRKVCVARATFEKIPFDLDRWLTVSETADSLPDPCSDEPTQWPFEGHPVGSTDPLQVAVARLLGYRWPQQKADDLDTCAVDGILCLPPVVGEPLAAERLRVLLAAAYGQDWSLARQDDLLAAVGFSGKDLGGWLHDGFFAQHCKVFKNRPFIWHIWDGRKDGFSALVNYHKLDAALLDKLIYTYLGDWIRVQRSRRDAGEAGAEGRLVAAIELQKKLEAIRDGEPPYDIYGRWKPLHEQPIGWNPDLNDGVRLNIHPFVTAGVLRRRFTVHWRKDRGKNPDGSERHNDLHFTVAEKLEARRQWEASKQGQAAKKRKGQA